MKAGPSTSRIQSRGSHRVHKRTQNNILLSGKWALCCFLQIEKMLMAILPQEEFCKPNVLFKLHNQLNMSRQKGEHTTLKA